MLGFGQSHVELDAERLDNIGLEPVVHSNAGDTPQDLCRNPAIGDRVIAVTAVKLPQRHLGRNGLDDRRHRKDFLKRRRVVDRRKTRPVTDRP